MAALATTAPTAADPAADPAARGRLALARAEALTGYVFAAPAALLMLALLIAPVLAVVAMSFTDYLLGAMEWGWVGTANYEALAGERTFRRAFANTLLYVAMVVPFGVGLALLVAILVDGRCATRRFYQTVYFLPVTTTLIAMSVVWHFVLNPQLGPVTAAARALGFGGFDVFGDPDLVLIGLAAIGVWQIVGFNMVLFIAGLTAIPRDLYDAAEIDGADGAWDRFARVTWPMLAPTTIFVVVTTTITAFRIFDIVAVITRGEPLGRSDVLLYAIYFEGFQNFNVGLGAAMTVVFLGLVVGLALLQAFILDRRAHYG
jgi:multiple sugar transport system permease protein